jgi:DNA-binding NarL/FixJ family response regulator
MIPAVQDDLDIATADEHIGSDPLRCRVLEFLSPREWQILRLVAAGATNRQIAADLDLSAHTVKRHIARIASKLKVRSRGEAAGIYRDLSRGGHPPDFNIALLRELTLRETEVLARIANGSTSLQIAGDMAISFHTVKRHTSSIFAKLDVRNRAHAAAFAHAAKASGFGSN